MDSIAGGWELGSLAIWESGAVFSVSSNRRTAGDLSSFANYTGDRSVGQVERRGGGIYWFTADQVRGSSFPEAGEFGSSGRNTFRGPGFFDIDTSLVKRFRFAERHAMVVRAELYNIFNTGISDCPT
jgi:hypothetical protein